MIWEGGRRNDGETWERRGGHTQRGTWGLQWEGGTWERRGDNIQRGTHAQAVKEGKQWKKAKQLKEDKQWKKASS